MKSTCGDQIRDHFDEGDSIVVQNEYEYDAMGEIIARLRGLGLLTSHEEYLLDMSSALRIEVA